MQRLKDGVTLKHDKEAKLFISDYEAMISPMSSECKSCLILGRVATKIFKDFGDALFKVFIIGWDVGNLYQLSTTLGLEPVSIIDYTRPRSRIKQLTLNYLATQLHVN